jgi:hypothetical protein
MGEQRVELLVDPMRQLIQVSRRLCPDEQVEADGKQPLIPALQAFSQTLGILERDLALRVRNALAAQGGQPGRLQPGNLNAQGTDHLCGGEWAHVQAELKAGAQHGDVRQLLASCEAIAAYNGDN